MTLLYFDFLKRLFYIFEFLGLFVKFMSSKFCKQIFQKFRGVWRFRTPFVEVWYIDISTFLIVNMRLKKIKAFIHPKNFRLNSFIELFLFFKVVVFDISTAYVFAKDFLKLTNVRLANIKKNTKSYLSIRSINYNHHENKSS